MLAGDAGRDAAPVERAGPVHCIFAGATTATLRHKLIAVPARIASSARRLTLHLPAAWPWASAWIQLFTHARGPPNTATT